MGADWRQGVWLSVGLGLVACGSSEKLVREQFDAGKDVPTIVGANPVASAREDAGAADGGLVSDGGVCSAATLGPTQEGAGRYTVAWTFSPASAADAGTPGPETENTGTADTPSRCVTSSVNWAPSYVGYLCRGGAWLRPAATGPVLTFDDGSTLTWNPDVPPAPAPYVQEGGERVWARYQTGIFFLCQSCGYATNRWVEIRDTGSGKVRHYAQQGSDLSSPLELAAEMFGVQVREHELCTIHVSGCVSLDRTECDHRVETIPVQTIPFATLTEVTAPGGTYDLLWATTSETNVKYSCADTPGKSNDNGFVATRRAP